MKKKICALLLTFAMLLTLLSACGGGSDTAAPTRGSWDGNTFTSSYLGLQFTSPGQPWHIFSNDEIAERLELTDGQMGTGTDIPNSLWTDPGFVIDFVLVNAENGSSVGLVYERFLAGVSEQIHLRACGDNEIEMYAEEGFEVEYELTGTIMIAGIEWHAKRTTIDLGMPGLTLLGLSSETIILHLVNRDGRFFRCVSITVSSEEELAEIMSWFSPYGG